MEESGNNSLLKQNSKNVMRGNIGSNRSSSLCLNNNHPQINSSNKRWLERDAINCSKISRSRYESHDAPVFIRGDGCFLYDANGKDYLDLTSGFSVVNLGHSNPDLINHAISQLETLFHTGGYATPWKIELAERLNGLAPIEGKSKVHFCVGGSRAVEVAWKAASKSVNSKYVMSFRECYHGRSLGVTTLHHIPDNNYFSNENINYQFSYPYCYRCNFRRVKGNCDFECVKAIDDHLKNNNDSKILLLEPALGARGYIFPPQDYFTLLRAVADKYGVIIIDDEIQMSLGRTGTMFCCEHYNFKPDIILISKSLGGGIFPISAVIGPSEIMDAISFVTESETFSSNPLGASLGLFVLNYIDTHNILRNSLELGEYFLKKITSFFHNLPIHGYAEGKGLAIGIEFVKDNGTKEPDQAFTKSFVKNCFDRGILLHHTGIYKNRVSVIPPLTITKHEIDEAHSRMEDALRNTIASL